jgi:hypothetical protein
VSFKQYYPKSQRHFHESSKTNNSKNETMVNEEKTSDAGPMNIATISAGFEKGDFLVREEQGNRVYFDFFEEVRRMLVAAPTQPRGAR